MSNNLSATPHRGLPYDGGMKLKAMVFKLESPLFPQGLSIGLDAEPRGEMLSWFDAGHRLLQVTRVLEDTPERYKVEGISGGKPGVVEVTAINNTQEYNELAAKFGLSCVRTLEEAQKILALASW